MHDYGHGRSLTHHHDRPFSITREAGSKQKVEQYRPTVESRSRTVGTHGVNGIAPAVATHVYAVFYITNFPNRLLYVDLRKGLV